MGLLYSSFRASGERRALAAVCRGHLKLLSKQLLVTMALWSGDTVKPVVVAKLGMLAGAQQRCRLNGCFIIIPT